MNRRTSRVQMMAAKQASQSAINWTQNEEESEDRMHGIVASGMSTERWAAIQRKTFTKWCNKQLAVGGYAPVEDCVRDFSTGVKLCELAQALAKAPFGRFIQTPRMRVQYFENVNKALSFFSKNQGVALVNVGADNIVDMKENINLGMVWSLISKYSITLSRNDLSAWIRQMLAEAEYRGRFNNYNVDWNNGKALCHLIEACKPGTLDMSALPDDSAACASLGMSAGERLGVPALVDLEDFIDPNIDDLSMMTYLIGFYHMFPSGPPPPVRDRGYTEGLYVEVLRGPPSDIVYENNENQGHSNNRALTYMPCEPGMDSFVINILWKGKPVTREPIVVKSYE